MNILYIGSGFVGACSAAVSAASGHNVLVYDIDETKINKIGSQNRDQIEDCIFEKGLSDLLIQNKKNISFTADYSKVNDFVDIADAVFMCLPTPEIGETGESNLSYYFTAATKLADSLLKRNEGKQEKYVVIVNKSTVPIDMVNKTQEVMDECGVKNYGVVSNPEFLVEGKAVSGSLKPSRVVIGAWEEDDFAIMRKVYNQFFESPDVKYIEVNPHEASAGKLLANFYLFIKLQICFDVIGRTCESFDNLQFENLRKIIMSDSRIGNWGLYNSLYAGGSCFIKDSRSLAHQIQATGGDATLVNETYLSNKRQLDTFIARAEKEAQFDWGQKKVAILGASFKRDTNDVRNSPSIGITKFLQNKNVSDINIFDPSGIKYYRTIFEDGKNIHYCDNEIEAIKDVDVIIISTDWPQFRSITDYLINEVQTRPLIMDGRRMLQQRFGDLQQAGYDIIAVGSPFIKGKK